MGGAKNSNRVYKYLIDHLELVSHYGNILPNSNYTGSYEYYRKFIYPTFYGSDKHDDDINKIVDIVFIECKYKANSKGNLKYNIVTAIHDFKAKGLLNEEI